MLSNSAFAFSFQDLWFNQNQQAARLLDQQKNSEAAAKFSDNHWKGVAYYRDKNMIKLWKCLSRIKLLMVGTIKVIL